MAKALHHASITTADMNRLIAFYRDLFGLDIVLQSEWHRDNAKADAIYGLKETSVRMAILRIGNAFLELFEFRHPVGKASVPDRPVCDQGITHFCIMVDDIDAEYERLSALGVVFHCPPQPVPGLCKATYLRDPDGNIVELMQPDPGGPFALQVQGGSDGD